MKLGGILNLLKTSFLTLLSTIAKMISGLVINKAVSVFVGPSGLALIGQFQNTLQMMMVFAQGGINSGVTKYTAEYGSGNDNLSKLWSTSAKITLYCSIVFGAISILFSSYLSENILKSEQYGYIFIILGFTLVFFTLNQLLLSIINGLKQIKLFVFINITQSIYGLVFTTLLIIFFGLDGALIALVTNQSLIFFVVLWKLRRHKDILLNRFFCGWDGVHAKKLSSYSLMAVTSVCTAPISLILVRNYIGESISWDAAGYWQAMLYISSIYLMIVTTALSTYYLPRLSEITERLELRSELIYGYKIIIPIVITLSFCIYFLKDLILWLLFSDDFKPMLDLFKWQLVGDCVKIMSWLLGYILIAKAKVKVVMFSEFYFSLQMVGLSVLFVSFYGLVGVTYAYVLNYVTHLFFMFYVTKELR